MEVYGIIVADIQTCFVNLKRKERYSSMASIFTVNQSIAAKKWKPSAITNAP